MTETMSRTECQGFAALVDEYMDGELDPRLRAACEAHVASCPECGQWLARARRAQELLASGPRVEPGRGFRLALRGRLEVEQLRRRRRERVIRSAAAFLAPATVAALVLVQHMPAGRDRLPEASRVTASAAHGPTTGPGTPWMAPPQTADTGAAMVRGADPAPVPRLVVPSVNTPRSRRGVAPHIPKPTPAAASPEGPTTSSDSGDGLDSVLEAVPAPSVHAPIQFAADRHSPSYVTPALAQTAPATPAPPLVRPLPAPDGVFAAGRDTTFEV